MKTTDARGCQQAESLLQQQAKMKQCVAREVETMRSLLSCAVGSMCTAGICMEASGAMKPQRHNTGLLVLACVLSPVMDMHDRRCILNGLRGSAASGGNRAYRFR